ncbi:unnamed protein product [Cercospora beticola]|nr:unnamed protein product [Cercospora beticola]
MAAAPALGDDLFQRGYLEVHRVEQKQLEATTWRLRAAAYANAPLPSFQDQLNDLEATKSKNHAASDLLKTLNSVRLPRDFIRNLEDKIDELEKGQGERLRDMERTCVQLLGFLNKYVKVWRQAQLHNFANISTAFGAAAASGVSMLEPNEEYSLSELRKTMDDSNGNSWTLAKVHARVRRLNDELQEQKRLAGRVKDHEDAVQQHLDQIHNLMAREAELNVEVAEQAKSIGKLEAHVTELETTVSGSIPFDEHQAEIERCREEYSQTRENTDDKKKIEELEDKILLLESVTIPGLENQARRLQSLLDTERESHKKQDIEIRATAKRYGQDVRLEADDTVVKVMRRLFSAYNVGPNPNLVGSAKRILTLRPHPPGTQGLFKVRNKCALDWVLTTRNQSVIDFQSNIMERLYIAACGASNGVPILQVLEIISFQQTTQTKAQLASDWQLYLINTLWVLLYDRTYDEGDREAQQLAALRVVEFIIKLEVAIAEPIFRTYCQNILDSFGPSSKTPATAALARWVDVTVNHGEGESLVLHQYFTSSETNAETPDRMSIVPSGTSHCTMLCAYECCTVIDNQDNTVTVYSWDQVRWTPSGLHRRLETLEFQGDRHRRQGDKIIPFHQKVLRHEGREEIHRVLERFALGAITIACNEAVTQLL